MNDLGKAIEAAWIASLILVFVAIIGLWELAKWLIAHVTIGWR